MSKLSNDQKTFIHEKLIDKYDLEPHEISPESNLETDFGLDSLDKVELIIEVESELNILIPDAAVEDIDTLQDLYNMVESKL